MEGLFAPRRNSIVQLNKEDLNIVQPIGIPEQFKLTTFNVELHDSGIIKTGLFKYSPDSYRLNFFNFMCDPVGRFPNNSKAPVSSATIIQGNLFWSAFCTQRCVNDTNFF